jgi:hypothetical protein
MGVRTYQQAHLEDGALRWPLARLIGSEKS